MNEWQVMRQVEYLLRQRKWTGGGSTPVFAPGSVLSSVAPEENSLRTMISPIALLKPVDGQSDPEMRDQVDLYKQGMDIQVIVINPGDAIGHKALMGGNRPTTATFGQLSSKGRGLLEVQSEVAVTVRDLTNVNGVRIQLSGVSRPGAQIAPGNMYIAWRSLHFEMWVGQDLFYHPCRNFLATAIGGGQVSMTWKIPPTRWDSYRVILRRAAGSTPPADITSGTGISLSGNLATSKTDTPGAGTFSYSLFFTYDETNTFNAISPLAAQDQRSSDAATKTLVVT